MNVWIRVTRKRAKCNYCNQMIETGEYQVICRYFMKLKHSARTWIKEMHFHAKDPYCWVDRAVAELSTRPYIENRGKTPLPINDEQREARKKLLQRRASVIQRINKEMETARRPDKLIHLTDMLEKFAEEIKLQGGLPISWQ